MSQARVNRAANRFFAAGLNGFVSIGEIIGEKAHQAAGNREHDGGEGEKIRRADILDIARREERSQHSPERSTDSYETIEAFSLFDREEVGHESPENGGVKQIEDADPNVKSASDPDLLVR